MNAILNFVNEASYKEHAEYLNNLKLKYSILKKSESRLSGLELFEIDRHREIRREIRREALELLSEIKVHEIYFSSFGERGGKCPSLKEKYGSESSFLYEMLKKSVNFGDGFCYVYKVCGEVYFNCAKSPCDIFCTCEPLVCIDLCEHAYFRDYGFKREEYLKRAFFYLNLSRIL